MNDPSKQQPVGTDQGAGKRGGVLMMVAAWVVGLALAMHWFDDVLQEQYNPNSDPQSLQGDDYVELVLQRNRYNHYVVSGSINNAPAVFLLDTGATDVVVPARLANRYGLQRGATAYAETANGQVQIYTTTVASLTIGDIRLNNVRANINPGMDGEEILLGMSALKAIEFSQRGNMLTLRQY